MINKIRDAFNSFVGDCLKHEPAACMNDFSIEINDAMANKIDEWVKEHCIKHKNSDGKYTLGGAKITVYENFGSPFLQPEPPLIWFLCRRYRHGKFCTIDENGNVVSAVERVKIVEYPKIPVPKVQVIDGHAIWDYNIDWTDFDRKMKIIDSIYENAAKKG